MIKATRRLTNISFEKEGAHVALVGKHQGGPANGIPTLITKATSDITDEAFNKALESTSEGTVSSTQEEVDKSVADKSTVTKEETNMTQEELQAHIEKAAEALVSTRIEEVEKAAKEREESIMSQLSVMKAAEDARTAQVFMARAEELTKALGEGTDKEALAKALRKAEGDAELEVLVKSLTSLAGAKEQEPLLEEVGKSATQEQELDLDTRVEQLVKSKMEANPDMNEIDATDEAFNEILEA